MTPESVARRGRGAVGLVVAVSVASMCGLVYELVAGAMSSYLLGNSVQQFSLVIGVFLSGMGVGSWVSQWIRRELFAWFAGVEVAVGLAGGLLPLVGFAAFAWTGLYTPILLTLTGFIGALIGLEIPLVLRLMRQSVSLRSSVAQALAADYGGALLASLAFPFFLLPVLGIARAAAVSGLLNAAVGGWILWRFRDDIGPRLRAPMAAMATASCLALGVVALVGPLWVQDWERQLYQDDILYAADTPYQRMVVTRWRNDVRLFLDGNLQFSSVDEYRYHEALVHPAMAAAGRAERVAILGGGDGMAAREVLKYPHVKSVDLVDLDLELLEVFRTQPLLRTLHADALSDSRVRVIAEDAMRYLAERRERGAEPYDVIVIDLPDPNSVALGKLYTAAFYRLVLAQLAPSGVFVTQATSPFATADAFWCIVETIESTARLRVRPYRAAVPSFGEWGFAMASRNVLEPASWRLSVPTRYLTDALLPALFALPGDMKRRVVPENTLAEQPLVRLYREGLEKHY